MERFMTSDYMTVAIARLLQDEEIVFHGVSSPIPMVAIALAKAMHAPNIKYVNIPGGVDGSFNKMKGASTAGGDLLKDACAYFPLADVFDLSMRGELDVAFLSGVQFDNKGNVNASVIGDYHKPKVRLPGGAGSAVLIPTARKPIIWRTKHDKRTFVKECCFNTTKGSIYRYITPLCIFKMKHGEVVLDSIFPTATLQDVVDNTGFEIKYDEIKYVKSPTQEEMRLLNRIDPNRIRNMEFE